MTMNIRCVAGDIAEVAPVEAEAAALWQPIFFTRGPWERISERCPELIALEGDALVEWPWDSDADTLWEVSPPLGQLCYLLVFTNPRMAFGCFGWDQVREVVSRALDRFAGLGVRHVAMHIPVYQPEARHVRRTDNKKCVEGMTKILRNWEKSNPGQIEEVLLVDKVFYFPDSLEFEPPHAGSEADKTEFIPQGNEPERPYPLSIHGSWMLDSSIEKHAENKGEWREAALREAAKLRAWAQGVDPNYLILTIQSMDALIRANENAGVTDREENPTCPIAHVQSCDLERLNWGNASEFPFSLSIAGAWVLLSGIKEYAQDTRNMYAVDDEDAGYCSLRASTVLTEVEKVRQWAEAVETTDGKVLAQAVKCLTQKLIADRQQFETLVQQEDSTEGRQGNSGEDPEDPV